MDNVKRTITAYHDPDPSYFTLSEAELGQLKDKARIPEKENTLFLFGLLVPTVVNLLGQCSANAFAPDWLFIVNVIILVVTALLAFCQGKEWLVNRGEYDRLITDLKKRPQLEFQFSGDANQYTATPSPLAGSPDKGNRGGRP